jgi:hypothetical protein
MGGMSMQDPVCPYCGTVMTYECTYDSGLSYSCKNCWSESPFIKYKDGEDTKALCTEAALRRPLQKPLTLEELKAISETGSHCIYIEHYHPNPDIENPITPNVGIKSGLGYRITHCNGYRYEFWWKDYGKTWRAWATRPTDVERAAAPWEE